MAKPCTVAATDVSLAGSMAEGILVAESRPFDVIVSDIGLPDGTGFDLMVHLRTRLSTPSIALTGYGMDSDIRRSLDVGFTAHLTKPVDYPRRLEVSGILWSLARRRTRVKEDKLGRLACLVPSRDRPAAWLRVLRSRHIGGQAQRDPSRPATR